MGTDSVELTAHTARATWAPNPLRHPIRSWRTRHIRRIMLRPLPPIEQHTSLSLQRALLYGEDVPGRRGD